MIHSESKTASILWFDHLEVERAGGKTASRARQDLTPLVHTSAMYS